MENGPQKKSRKNTTKKKVRTTVNLIPPFKEIAIYLADKNGMSLSEYLEYLINKEREKEKNNQLD